MSRNAPDENDDYLVRVKALTNDAGLFTWEICSGDGLLVLQQSPNTFPTRVEALFDSAQKAAVLKLGAMPAHFLSSRAFP